MIFSAAPMTESFDLARWTSESGRWEFGLRRVLYGVRVCANPVGNDVYAVDYCAGADAAHITFIRMLVHTILEGLPESATAAEVECLMPAWTRRPIHKDQACLDALIQLAGQALAQQRSGAA